MEPDACLALTLTPVHRRKADSPFAARIWLAQSRIRRPPASFGRVHLPAPAAQAIYKRQSFWRAEKEVCAIRRIGCRTLNGTEPEHPQSLLQKGAKLVTGADESSKSCQRRFAPPWCRPKR
jgi:hypothetical protein